MNLAHPTLLRRLPERASWLSILVVVVLWSIGTPLLCVLHASIPHRHTSIFDRPDPDHPVLPVEETGANSIHHGLPVGHEGLQVVYPAVVETAALLVPVGWLKQVSSAYLFHARSWIRVLATPPPRYVP